MIDNIQTLKDNQEDEDIEENINQIRRDGDLSPRSTRKLKINIKIKSLKFLFKCRQGAVKINSMILINDKQNNLLEYKTS